VRTMIAAVLQTTQHEPYGKMLNRSNDNRPGYTGHMMDKATGLVYMQQRYYDPLIPRFLSVDPITAYSNPVGAFNRYWYANNNPYRFFDPDGRSACPGSSRTCCIQSDTYNASRSTGQTTQASESVGRTMVEQKGVVAVTGGTTEEIGFVTPTEGGGHRVELAADATTGSTSRTDTASATIPAGAEAVIHGHIDGRSDGVISPADAAPLKHGLPNEVVSEGRVGVTEIVSGRLQFRMLDGRMTQREARELQRSLDRQQRQPEFMRPEGTP
jgi:RHS repeat-associated protein